MTKPPVTIPPVRIRQDVKDDLQQIADSDAVTLSFVVCLALAEFLGNHASLNLEGGSEERRRRAAQVDSVRKEATTR